MNSKEIKHLSSLLRYGSLKVGKTLDSSSGLKTFLLVQHTAMHSYAESIVILCSRCLYVPAGSMLRTMYEAHLSLSYILSKNSQKRLLLYAKKRFKDLKSLSFRIQTFLSKNPNHVGSASMYELKEVEKMRLYSEEEIEKLEKKLSSSDNWPKDVFALVESIDKDGTYGRGEFESGYHIIYKFLSTLTHINAESLEHFVEVEDGIEKFTYGKSRDVDIILNQAFLFYYSSLESLFSRNIISGSISQIHKSRYQKIISHQTQSRGK